MDNQLKIEQYLTLITVIESNKQCLKSRQRDALVGMKRKLQKGICTQDVTKRIDGLFKYVQKQAVSK
jgi:hypothetical protein